MDNILSFLVQGNIINDEEKTCIVNTEIFDQKLAIYKLLKKADWITTRRILQRMKNYTATPIPRYLVKLETNPLQINHIIKHLFQYLDFASLKGCNLVSTKWNSIADTMLKSKSKIKFQNQINVISKVVGGLENFLETFPTPLNCITGFSFMTNVYSVESLKRLFTMYQSAITHLELEQAILPTGVAISYYIPQLVTTDNITDLCINSRKFDTNMEIPLRAFPNARNLNLTNCCIESKMEAKIRPVKIKLVNPSLMNDENEIRINDIIDFRNAKTVTIDGSETRIKIKLDVGSSIHEDVVKINQLFLNRVTVENYNHCNWIVDTFVSGNSCLIENSTMDCRVLKMYGHYRAVLGFLPLSIEELHLMNANMNIECSANEDVQEVNLPNLKKLYSHGNLRLISHFRTCNKLEQLHLEGEVSLSQEHDNECTVYGDHLPKNLKTLKLKDMKISYENQDDLTIRKIDVLILDKYSFSDSSNHVMVVANVVVINWEPGKHFETADSAAVFIQKGLFGTAVIGPIVLTRFKQSKLSHLVDVRSNYYFVSGLSKRGVAIPQEDFEQFMDMSNTDIQLKFFTIENTNWTLRCWVSSL